MNEDTNGMRATAHERAIGRWENEGGAVTAWAHPMHSRTVAGKIGNAEDGNMRVRLIAIENILVALLASSPVAQLDLIREMAAYISPRPGKAPHRLTVEAARNMLAILERAGHYRNLGQPGSHS